MSATAIEWAMLVWNAIVGCTRVSQGCVHCYAELMAWRHVLMCRALGRRCKYEGTVHLVGGKPRWTGKLNFDEESVSLPLRRKKPATWFVNSMSDLFHENARDEWIDQMFAIMAQSPQHTFQILTKRPDRMLAYFRHPDREEIVDQAGIDAFQFCHSNVEGRWPLPNVHLGVSVELQPEADERIPLLLQTPAAVRWVSYEPALGPVDFTKVCDRRGRRALWMNTIEAKEANPGHAELVAHFGPDYPYTRLDWIVVGGESGPGARLFDIAWARQTVAQCRAAGVPVFVKQLGAKVHDGRLPLEPPWTLRVEPVAWREWSAKGFWCDHDGVGRGPTLYDRKGGDCTEWPEDLRVRELPTGEAKA